jgi:hypothetical protein
MLHETYQRQYDLEHSHRAELSAGVNAPVAAITLVASATAIATLDYPYLPSAFTTGFLAFAGATLLALVCAAYYVFRSLWNYKYEKLASPLQLRAYEEQLLTWYGTQGQSPDEAKLAAEHEVSQEVTRKLCEATDWNGQINLRRGNFLHMGTTAVAISLASFLPMAGIYAVAKASAPEKVNAVHVVNLHQPQPENVVSNGKPTQGTSAPKPGLVPTASPSPTISPVKPQIPNNSQFRTNTEIPAPTSNSGSGGSKE